MGLKKLVAKNVVHVSKFLLKGTRLEHSPLVSTIYRKISFLGYGRPTSPLKFREFELHVDVSDESILPGLLNGTYEEAELDFVKITLKPGDCFIDVGANIGIYSVLAAEAVGPSGKVFAFEPSPKALALLRQNVTTYPQVEIIPKAVGASSQKAHMVERPRALGSSQVSTFSNGSSGHNSHQISVDMVSLDEAFHGSRLDFIKIDVKGGEKQVIAGASRILQQFQPKILLEWNPYLLSQEEKWKWAHELFKMFQTLCYISDTGEAVPIHTPGELERLGLVNLLVQHFRGIDFQTPSS